MTETKAATSSLARHGAIMAAGSMVSRITGFGRSVAIGAALGTAVGNAYATAQYFPLMVYELVMGGTLTSVVVPLIVRAVKNDADKGEGFTQRLATLVVTLLATATAIMVACAPLLARAMASSDNRELVTQLSYFMLPALFFYGLSALLQAVLNTRDHFAAPMWAPILNNIVVIAVCGSFGLMYTVDDLGLDDVTAPMIALLGFGTMCGMVAQSLALFPSLRKVGFRWKWRFDFKKLPMGEIGRLAAWILCYVAFNQAGVVASVRIANAAGAQNDATGPLIYQNSYLFVTMAHGIVAVSVISALMPRLSAAASEKRFGDMANNMSSGMRLATIALVPIAVMYMIAGVPMAVLLFNHGIYGNETAIATGVVIGIGGLALIPFSISQFQIFAFYALTDSKTVALLNIPVIFVRIAGYVISLALLPPHLVVAAMMVSNGVSYLVSVMLSTVLLRRRIGLLGMKKTYLAWLRAAVAGAVAAGVGLAVLWSLPWLPANQLALLGELAGVGVIVMAVYFGFAYVLRISEVTDLTRTVKAKLGR